MDISAKKLFADIQDNLDANKDYDQTIGLLDSLLSDSQDPCSVYYYLGFAAGNKGHYAIAKEWFSKAFAIRQNHVLYNALGCCFRELDEPEKAIEYFNKSLELNPDDPLAHTNLAVCYVSMGEPQKAIPFARYAYKNMPDDPQKEMNLGQALLGIGKYREGFKHNEGRLLLNDRKEKFYSMNNSDPYWDGTKGKNIVVHGEQGLGDEIMFASMLLDVMGDCGVIYDCNSRLVNIMRNSFPDIPIYGTKQIPSDEIQWKEAWQVDGKISIGSLGKFYRKKESDFPGTPYLKADPVLIEKWRKRLAALGDRPKIGFSWYGGQKRIASIARFNPLHNWKEIFGMDADFISLQYNPEAGEKIERFNADNGINLHHWPEMLGDYDETAGLLMNLDLVISAPQSVVHLAGALGVPCWRLAAHRSMWIHGVHGKDAPWYKSVKNYWQNTHESWQDVMGIVGTDLKSFLANNKKVAA